MEITRLILEKEEKKLDMMFRIAILISDVGTGTNLQAIIDGVKKKKINARIVSVISDSWDAEGLKKVKDIPIHVIEKKENLLHLLNKSDVDYICLAGWKQFIPEEVIDVFPNRIINTHPGLIPDNIDGFVKNPDNTKALWNKGKLADKAIQNFLDEKATYAGSTNHFLTQELDFGPVLGRVFVKRNTGDTVQSLYKRLKVKENKLYVNVLKKLCSGYTVLITDAGGRGAVLVDKYAQSKKVGKILVVPGNDLMQINTKKPVIIFPELKTTSVREIIEICRNEKVDLIDVSQDNAVEVGLVNKLQADGFKVFGPTREAGQIEWDKSWARNFMKKYKIPSPKFYAFKSEKEGIEFVKNNPNKKWFVKASGLAEGKGAIPAGNINEAISAIKEMKKFGASGETFLLEEWLEGEEFSAFALCDGRSFKIVGFAQDHKRVNDGDKGPNTGGMGCVSNPLIVTKKINKVVEEIFEKTVAGLRREGRIYKGVLYLGAIVVLGKVYVIEFNARWGDPEAEVILPSIYNDFYDLANAVISGRLQKTRIKVDKKIRIAVAAVAKGYPGDYSHIKGKKFFGIDKAIRDGIKIYGAGIKKTDGDYIVNGGRVLFAVADGKNLLDARKKAYKSLEDLDIEGNNLHYRKDIGWRDLARLRRGKKG